MKKYQAVAFLLSTAMTVSSVAPVFGASNDIFGHWAEFTITKWQNEGRIGGYEDGTFKPDRAITRAEFVRLLNSAAPTAFTSSASINFSDVKESDWFYADVAKAVGGRVASGFEDGTFRPGETVTRMQAAVFICNAKGLTPNEAAANNFTDAASIPAWAKGAVGAAVAAGYLSGYPDGSFGGSKGMTRAEAVSTLDRVLGGGSTNTPSGEIDTTDRDNTSTEDNRTAEAGNMVWTSGGGGGSSKGSSSSSSSDKDKKTHNVTIRSQKEANDYSGKTLTGTTAIYVDGSGIDLQDIKFKGDVDIYADDTATAAAYIGEDTAVAAASSTVDIYFEGKTSVSGQITVIRNNVAGADKVVIRTRTPRALSASVLAKVATKIVGFELNKVEAQAPVEIAEGAKVNTVEAGDNAVVEVAADASVDKVDVTGDAKDIVLNGEGSTDVTVKNGATVENVKVNDNVAANIELEGDAAVTNTVSVNGNASADVKVNDNAKIENVSVSDSANADVAVADKATVNKVELSDTATAKVDVAPEAKVDTITSTSSGKTEVSGEGTVDKIEATNPDTIDTSNAGENIPDVEQKEDNVVSTEVKVTAIEITATKKVDGKDVVVEKGAEVSRGDVITMAAKVTPTNATNQKVNWAVTTGGNMAQIDGNGTLKIKPAAREAGLKITVTATATDGSNISSEFSVSVVNEGEPEKEVSSVAVKTPPAKVEYVAGEKLDLAGLVITVTYADSTTAEIAAANFAAEGVTTSPANDAVLTDTDKTVTITVGGKTATVNLTVTAPSTDVEKLAADKALIEAGTYEIPVASQTNQETKTAWVQAAVDKLIKYGTTAVVSFADGKYSVALTCGNETGTAAITVTEVVAVTGITIAAAGNATTVEAGKTLQFTETVTPDTATNKAVTWTATDASGNAIEGVTISESGLLSVAATVGKDTAIQVKATSVGTPTVSSDATTITVTEASNPVAVTGITIEAADNATTVEAGGTLQFTETVTPDTATNKAVTWTATDASGNAIEGVTISESGLLSVAATVGKDTAIQVKATSVGTPTVSSDATTITVTEASNPVAVTGITIEAADNATTVEAGGTLQFTKTVTPDTATNKAVTWTATDASGNAIEGVTISESGLLSVAATVGKDTAIQVKATSVGTPTVSSDATTITVTEASNPVAVTGITIEAADNATTIEAGGTLQFTETVTPDTATNKAVTWTATDASGNAIEGVTISESGLLSVAATVGKDTAIQVKATSVGTPTVSSTAINITVTEASNG
ncbi:S-layer homology domain-containing protein [Clostridium sp. MD294]|uniref:S-layer homology domain-containing protein n=1 Tax=Clostridium sp. MD294 TaxID=97138 RepID=UPI002073DA1B|nr:S-layer homology domain-containing protein [Clostridium sp. MD294]USF30686.1 hypothetical protein C820_002129 [Clostridium sp. MD294]